MAFNPSNRSYEGSEPGDGKEGTRESGGGIFKGGDGGEIGGRVRGCGGTDGGDWTGEMVVEVGFMGWMGCCGGVTCNDCFAVVEVIRFC